MCFASAVTWPDVALAAIVIAGVLGWFWILTRE